jgi:hypothetical protein
MPETSPVVKRIRKGDTRNTAKESAPGILREVNAVKRTIADPGGLNHKAGRK